MAWSISGQIPSAEWPAAQVRAIDAQTRAIVFQGSGRYRLHVRDTGQILDATIYREWTVPAVRAASEPVLRMPELSASIRGSMSSFDADLSYAHHGIAGPRYLIRADTPLDEDQGWSAIGRIPPRLDRDGRLAKKDGTAQFWIRHLPAGRFLFQDHLYSGGYRPKASLQGGLLVELIRGETTHIGELDAASPADLELLVIDCEGEPVTGATIQPVDPMAEAWGEFLRLPTTATFAGSPIPPPHAVSLDANGRCRVPMVRRSAIVLRAELDSGQRLTTRLAIPKEAGATATWVLPPLASQQVR